MDETYVVNTAAEAAGAALGQARTELGSEYFSNGSPGKAVEDAVYQVRQAVNGALKAAEAQATDNRVPAEGRKANVESLAESLKRDTADVIATADVAAMVARAQLYMDALPSHKGSKAEADSQLHMILSSTPAENRAAVVQSLAKRDNDMAASLCSEFGKTLITDAFGMDVKIYEGAKLNAVDAARRSNDPKRRQAGENYFRSASLRKAVDAAEIMLHSAGNIFGSLAAKAGVDPRDAELKRLRSIAGRHARS